MTGKQLKVWAETVHDDAIIEVDLASYSYSSGWKEVPHNKIRALLITSPLVEMSDVCNLEEASK